MFITFVILQLLFMHITEAKSMDIKRMEFSKKNCSHPDVNVRLSSFNEGKITGVVQLVLPKNSQQYPICYPPDNFESTRQMSLMSHVICRQLGYTTYSTKYPRVVDSPEMSMRAGNVICHGHEQHLSGCEWGHIYFERCNQVAVIQCTTCSYTIQASEGILSNPGYRYAYFYTVICEWNIVVPENHDVYINFQHFNLPSGEFFPLRCDGNNPFVEIIFGYYEHFTIKRFCQFNAPEPMRINYRNLTVRFSSGISNIRYEDTSGNHGFAIIFRGMKNDSMTTNMMKIVIASILLMLFFALVISCYCCRKFESKPKVQQITPNADNYEIQCEETRRISTESLFPFNEVEAMHNNSLADDDSSLQSEKIPFPIHEYLSRNREKDMMNYFFEQTPCSNSVSLAPEKPRHHRNLNLRKLILSKFTPRRSEESADSLSLSVELQTPRNNFSIYANSKSPPTPTTQDSFDETARKRSISENKENLARNTTPNSSVPTIVVSSA